jgi:hypothetical protein
MPDAGAVEAQIEHALQALRSMASQDGCPAPCFGVVSPLAEGADRLVVKAVLRQPGARLEAMLPLPIDDYQEDFSTPASRREFDRLLSLAHRTTIMPPMPSRDAAYSQAGQQVVARCDVLIALWDGLPARGEGGTAETVAWARAQGVPLVWILTEPPFTVQMERMEALGARLAKHCADHSASAEA